MLADAPGAGRAPRLWLITIGEPLPIEPGSRALRTRILASRLAERGADVLWWTSDFNHFSKQRHETCGIEVATDEGYRLRFVHGRAYQRNLSLSRQLNHIEIARDFVRQAATLERPDAIICSFPSIELAAKAAQYAKRCGAGFVLDVRDLWPDEIVERFPAAAKPLAAVLVSPLRAMVRRTARSADAIIGVSQAYLDWGLEHGDRRAGADDRVIPLGYPDHPLSREARQLHLAGAAHASDAPCHFFFSGSFNQSVDVGLIIEAFAQMPEAPIRATICGDGENATRWREAAAADERIEFTGWIGSAEIRARAREADVGLVCYRRASLVAMPNKLYEYLSFGLPVINGIAGEAVRLVEREQLGWNYEAGSRDALVAAMQAAIAAKRQGGLPVEKVVKIFEQRYSADTVYDDYATFALDMAARQGARAV